MEKKKVLIAGAAGRIGAAIRPFLRQAYSLRLTYRNTPIGAEAGEEAVHADLSRLEDALMATSGVDAVIHLAAQASGRASWEVIRSDNVDATYNVFEAARQNDVRKIVFASTNHVVGKHELDGLPSNTGSQIRPDSLYGVSKAFGEALGRYYSDTFGMSTICLRIGSFQPEPRVERMLATWLSPRDMAQLVMLSLESERRFGVYNALSGNSRRFWDLGTSIRDLGYAPQDDAEEFADKFRSAG